MAAGWNRSHACRDDKVDECLEDLLVTMDLKSLALSVPVETRKVTIPSTQQALLVVKKMNSHN